LLNNQLINYYDINFDFIKIINSYSSLNSYIYYVPQLLDNYNKINKKSVPDDVALYLYVTMKGLFWDEFTDTFPKYTRTDVKIEMFKDIFFGKRHGHKWSEFAESFMDKYPNVYSIINNKLKKESYKDLSAILTQTESKIFHSILTNLFEMGIETVNLHDSIVVLDTPKNENVTEEMIIGVMEKVYYEHSIIPSFSTDYFSVTQFEEEVKKTIQ
ncbi:MAG: hypothetical protein LBH12_01725, partial [Dysgonamonadaceae bacterium]|nr:hypothetical protein [Dysgonamonadaceae bacterium]